MPPRDSVEYVQKEHLEILRVTERLADALALAAKEDFRSRQDALEQLRDLRQRLVGISQHCNAENSLVESDFHHFLDATDYDQLRKQERNIARIIAGMLRELPYATADSVAELCAPGLELLEKIREHITFEEEMLWKVDARRLELQPQD
jgi:hemerythrin-like domain-containing protein